MGCADGNSPRRGQYRLDGSSVAQRVRARCWGNQGRCHKGAHEAEMSEIITPVHYLQSMSYRQSARVLRRFYLSNAYLQLSIHQLALFVSQQVGIQVPVAHFHIESVRGGSHNMAGGTYWTRRRPFLDNLVVQKWISTCG